MFWVSLAEGIPCRGGGGGWNSTLRPLLVVSGEISGITELQSLPFSNQQAVQKQLPASQDSSNNTLTESL